MLKIALAELLFLHLDSFKVPEVAHFQESFYPFGWWPEYFRISSSFSLLILAKRSELNFFTPLIPLQTISILTGSPRIR